VAAAGCDRLIEQRGITRHRSSLEQQRRIGSGVNRLEASNRLQIARVGDDGSDGFELFQLGRHGRYLICRSKESFPDTVTDERSLIAPVFRRSEGHKPLEHISKLSTGDYRR